MTRYVIASVVGGTLFGALDALMNANPVANKLFEVYKPIARTSLNLGVGIAIDLAYGFALAGLFLLVYPSLPGGTGLVKGLSFALIVWFLRVTMSAVSQWLMFTVPLKTLLYTLSAGLGEMLVLGMLYGLVLQPAR